VKIDTGDNAMALKSGKDMAGVRAGRPTRNIVIRDSVFTSASWAIGSEMSGGVHDVVVDNCKFGSDGGYVWKMGIMIKSLAGRGGEISNITIKNSLIHAGDNDPSGHPPIQPLTVDLFYSDHSVRELAGDPVVRGIHFENMTISCGTGCPHAGIFLGLMDSPIHDLSLTDVHFVHGRPGLWLCGNVESLMAEGVFPGGLPGSCPLIKAPEDAHVYGDNRTWIPTTPSPVAPALPLIENTWFRYLALGCLVLFLIVVGLAVLAIRSYRQRGHWPIALTEPLKKGYASMENLRRENREWRSYATKSPTLGPSHPPTAKSKRGVQV